MVIHVQYGSCVISSRVMKHYSWCFRPPRLRVFLMGVIMKYHKVKCGRMEQKRCDRRSAVLF
jgi:hypothetical protein